MDRITYMMHEVLWDYTKSLDKMQRTIELNPSLAEASKICVELLQEQRRKLIRTIAERELDDVELSMEQPSSGD